MDGYHFENKNLPFICVRNNIMVQMHNEDTDKIYMISYKPSYNYLSKFSLYP